MAIHLSRPILLKRPGMKDANNASFVPGEQSLEPREPEFDTAELPVIGPNSESAMDDAPVDASPETAAEPIVDTVAVETTESVEAIAPAASPKVIAVGAVIPSDDTAGVTEASLVGTGASIGADADTPAELAIPDGRHANLQRLALYTRIAAVSIVTLLLAVVVGFQIAERDEVRVGVQAYGVDLGGMTRDDARVALIAETERQRQTTFTLVDSKGEWALTTADLGLSMDVDKTVEDAFAQGRTGWGPSRLSMLWHMRSDADVVGTDTVGIQADLLDGKLIDLDHATYQQKVDPALSVSPDTGVNYTRHVVGRKLDVAATRNAILTALTNGDMEVQLRVNETLPVAYDADYAAVRKQLANLFNGDIKLNAPGDYWMVTPQQLSQHLTIVPAANGQPAALQINDTWVGEVVWQISLATDSYPQSPRIWWGDGGIVKTADGKPGLDLNEEEGFTLLRAIFLGEQEANEVTMPVAVTKTPELPADLNSIGVVSQLASASTPYGGGLPERAHNIELAARLLNGTVIMPGQTFSFNAEIGDMTVAAGFQTAYGIATENGQTTTVPAEAGGICQVSTTVFQPVFWMGYEINQRGWHALWIPRYAYNGIVGLDATVEPSVGQDFKWTNNTGTAVMLETYADGQNFTVQLYGTPPNWRVEVDQPVISNQKSAEQEIVYQPSDTIPVGTTRGIEHAQDGFDANITRRVIEGDQVREEQFFSSYAPARNVVLVGSEDGELPAGYANTD